MQKIISFFQQQTHFTEINRNIIAFLFTLLLIPTFLVSQVGVGLDPSWILGLNISISNNQIFGQDYIFTYGVLGFLQTKCAYNISKWYLLLFDVFLLLNIYWTIKTLLKKVNILKYYFLVILILVFVGKCNFFVNNVSRNVVVGDIIMLIACGILLSAIQSRKIYYFISFVVLSALAIHIKISYGFLLIIMFSMGLLYAFWQKIFSYQWLLMSIFLYLSTFLGVAFYHNVNIIGYFREGNEIIRGYNEGMFMVSDVYHLALALIIILCFFVSMYFQYRSATDKIQFFFVFCVIGLTLFYVFKAQFVRAEGRQMMFFGYVCGVYGLYFLNLQKILPITKTLFGIVLSICVIFVGYNKIGKGNYEFNAFFSVQYFKDIIQNTDYRNQIEEKGKMFIPEKIVQIINKGNIDILPTEISLIYSYKLKYNPRPIPQSYSAYTSRLDSLNAHKYLSKNAPDFLIFNNQSIDNRYNFWDESKTKLAILTNYELVITQDKSKEENGQKQELQKFDEQFYLKKYPDIAKAVENKIQKSGYEHYINFGKQEGRIPYKDYKLKIEKFDEEFYLKTYPDIADAVKQKIVKSGYEHYIQNGKNEGRIPYPDYFDMLVLKKLQTPKKIKTAFLKKTTEKFGKPIKIANHEKMLYIYPKIKYNVLGGIAKILYRPPFIQAKIKYENGQEQIFKAILPILEGGILANFKTLNNQEASNFFENNLQKNKKIIEITFFSEYEKMFVSKNFEVLWQEKSIEN